MIQTFRGGASVRGLTEGATTVTISAGGVTVDVPVSVLPRRNWWPDVPSGDSGGVHYERIDGHTMHLTGTRTGQWSSLGATVTLPAGVYELSVSRSSGTDGSLQIRLADNTWFSVTREDHPERLTLDTELNTRCQYYVSGTDPVDATVSAYLYRVS